MLTRFGGVQNYEDFRLRPYNAVTANPPKGPDSASLSADLKAGDRVVVAFLQGYAREGIILGGLGHPARKTQLELGQLAYACEFNGIETTISKTGQYRITFKAPITDNINNHQPGQPIPAQVTNTEIGGTYYELGDDGSWTVNDNKSQFIKINKKSTLLTLTSGKTSIIIDGANGKVSMAVPTEFSIKADKAFSVKAETHKTEAVKSLSIKSPKIAIGGDSFELLDGLIKLLDYIGQIVVTSPVGPCPPLSATPVWPQIEQIKQAITNLKGSL
jgi:hypothetical protein